MSETNLDWDDLRLFLAVARAGGLSGATQRTGKSAPTLGRRMAVLEELTGEDLFVRLAKGYELTDQGRRLLDKTLSLEKEILDLDHRQRSAQHLAVRISAGHWMTHMLCLNIKALLEDNEQARLRFISADEVLNISRKETTIGIRNSRPAQEHLVCRKTGRVRFAGYAVDKSVKNWIKVSAGTPSAQWIETVSREQTNLEVTAPRNALDLALLGSGRVVLPTFVGDRQTKLKRVTSTIAELAHDQWLVTHQSVRLRPEVRTTIDRLYAVIKDVLE